LAAISNDSMADQLGIGRYQSSKTRGLKVTSGVFGYGPWPVNALNFALKERITNANLRQKAEAASAVT
jgi:hypothetical protein